MKLALFSLALFVHMALASTSHADCIQEAAIHHGVNAEVLRAIGWHESRLRPQAIGRNTNGSIDIGAFQINSMHLGRLARYGLTAESLKDGCTSAYVGAWHFKQQVRRFGNTWFAVGAYHSHTPARAAWYANAIAKVLISWGVMPPGSTPYPTAGTLAPGSTITRPPGLRASRSNTLPHPLTVVYDDGLGAFNGSNAAPSEAWPPHQHTRP